MLQSVSPLASRPGSCCNHTTMFKTLFTLLLALAACKTDRAAETSASENPATPSTNVKPRSGKIDPPAVKPSLSSDDNDDNDDIDQRREDRRAQRIAEFDTDGDGKLSEAERQAIREKRMAEMRARLDTNKDGVISDEERTSARHQRVVDMRSRFDKDGDGKVTPAELESAPFGRFDGTADANGDGNVTTEELEAVMKDRMSQRGGFRRGGFRRGGGSGSAESQ